MVEFQAENFTNQLTQNMFKNRWNVFKIKTVFWTFFAQKSYFWGEAGGVKNSFCVPENKNISIVLGVYNSAWIIPWLNLPSRGFNINLTKGKTKEKNQRYRCDFHSCFLPDDLQLSDTFLYLILYCAQYIFVWFVKRWTGVVALVHACKISKASNKKSFFVINLLIVKDYH